MTEQDRELLRRFVSAFECLDELGMSSRNQICGDITSLLLPSADDDNGWWEWRPVPANLPRETLEEVYRAVPGPLPPLYEQLILSYHWAEVDLGFLTLVANLPPALHGLVAGITSDIALFSTLTPGGFVQFGSGPDMDYDPVCFDVHRREADGDCRIVKFDHEEIICNGRLKEVREIAPTFRRLVELVIEDAEKGGNKPA